MSATHKYYSAELPDGWRMVRLGDVAALRNTQVVPAENDIRPYVALEHIAAGGTLIKYTEARVAISNKTEFRCGDTLYGKLRPNLRKVVRSGFDGVCSTDILAIYGRERVDHRYLGHVLGSDPLYVHAMRGIAGTKMPRTSWNHLSKYRFACPPFAKQRAIANVLDSIDEAIERTEAVIAATETLRDALLHELLTRGVPGWHTDWKDVPGIGTIPADWEVVRLGEVAEVVGGSTPSKTDPALWEGTIPWVVPSELTELSGRYLETTRATITDQGMAAAGLKLVPAGSVLMTSRATIGTVAINSAPVTTNQGFQNLVPKARLHGLWLYYCISAKQNELRRHAAGSTFLEISRDNVRSLPIGLPKMHEQEAIANILDSIDKHTERAYDEWQTLASAKTSVADTLLSGRVRVANVHR